jgi:GT2 family glycosyltransferase
MQLTYQRNLGVEAANGDIILHLDDDTSLETDFIERLLEVFENDTEGAIGAVSGYVTNQWGDTHVIPKTRLKIFRWLGIYDGNFAPGSISSSGVFIELNALKPFTGLKRVDFISGISFAVRSAIYEKYDHPDVIKQYGGEDKAFSCLIAKEWGLYVCGDAKLEHYSASGGARPKNFIHTKSSVEIHIYIQAKYSSNKSTIRLRMYFLLLSLWMYTIGILGLVTIVKAKKSLTRFARASGYLSGAISRSAGV